MLNDSISSQSVHRTNALCDISGSISCDLAEDLGIFNSIDKVKDQINATAVNDAKKVLRDKCVNASGSEAAYTGVIDGAETFKNCITNLINFEQLQAEIDEARPKGEMDTVFNKWAHERFNWF